MLKKKTSKNIFIIFFSLVSNPATAVYLDSVEREQGSSRHLPPRLVGVSAGIFWKKPKGIFRQGCRGRAGGG